MSLAPYFHLLLLHSGARPHNTCACAPHVLAPAGCRECFLDILCEESREFVLEECSERRVRVWEEGKAAWQQVAIALMCLRRTYGGDTVGVKLAPREL
jgi:hypothetical protein